MSEVVEIRLEWKYTPENYLEEPIHIVEEGFELSISGGLAVARINPSFYEKRPDVKRYLTDLVTSRLCAVQVMLHSDFILHKPSCSDPRQDGGKNIYLEVEPDVVKVSEGPVDLVIRDENGNVVADTRRDRLDKRNWFANAITRYRSVDSTLDQMLKSYQTAVRDPKNELIHLYEIRDALTARFGNQNNAMKSLGITQGEWKIIGDLANNQPIKQGRHRGKSAGRLRPAQQHELELARKSAVSFVEKYLTFLESSDSGYSLSSFVSGPQTPDAPNITSHE